MAGICSMVMALPSAGADVGSLVPNPPAWVTRDGGLTSGGLALGVSPNGGRVYVTGWNDSGGLGDYATAAYDARSGNRLWAAGYDGPAGSVDVAKSLSQSPDASRVYVTGYSVGIGLDYATVAYDALTGTKLWVARFNGTANENDDARVVSASPDGTHVFVTGLSRGTTTYYDYVTIAYDAQTGAPLWTARYAGPAGSDDRATALAVSPDGSRVYVTGESGSSFSDYVTVAYDGLTGSQLWVADHNGPGNGFDTPTAILVDSAGNRVFVTGVDQGGVYGANATYYDYATVAYDALSGSELWVARYNSPLGTADGLLPVDGALAIAQNPKAGLVYVTGFSKDVYPNNAAATLAYDVGTGKLVWEARYKGPGGSFASALAVSPDGTQVYVTGASRSQATDEDYATLAYDAFHGTQLWVTLYNGPANGLDRASAVVVSPNGSEVFVTGYSAGGINPYSVAATVAYCAIPLQFQVVGCLPTHP
jgi:WD40 repeat protein